MTEKEQQKEQTSMPANIGQPHGKTPDGKVFGVPNTREMVSSLLNFHEPKNWFEKICLLIMAFEIGLLFFLPLWASRTLLMVLFAFWRIAYNVGLGYLLKRQSEHRWLVRQARKYKLFDQKANPKLYAWLEDQLSMKMGKDYDFKTAPLEYNTWMLYRQLVDIILMNDFTAYMCLAISWFNVSPQSSFVFGDAFRWFVGLFLIGFNIWVKIDAQRVVKDFAWYWGDFFFLIEQSLTFDGVFEMAPHPMYSVGYFGYYGVSLICASYTVLFVSIAAHILQFLFLIVVETPHIEKTYNPPIVQKKRSSGGDASGEGTEDKTSNVSAHSTTSPHKIHRDLMVFKNFDLCRSTDLVSFIVTLYGFITPMVVSGNRGVAIAVFQALFWCSFHSYGLGVALHLQSTNKLLTRHFIKWGGGVQETFESWKSIYNLSLCMTYVSFFVACCKIYSLPGDWSYGTTILRHTLGAAFISLHIWTSVSIYEVLGDFGWFYGDFFLDDHSGTLVYSGIYRFLNNPEKIMGHAAFWGMSLIANHRIIYALAIFSQLSSILFLSYVEAPHMRVVYGNQIRKEAGLTKTLKSAAVSIPKKIPDKLQQEVSKLISEKAELKAATNTTKTMERLLKDVAERLERNVEGTVGTVGEMIESARPHLQELLEETRALLANSRPRFIPTSIPNEVDTQESSQYTITLQNTKETTSQNTTPCFYLGHILSVHWTAPEHHGPRDWIGIYKVESHQSTLVTNVSSNGLWHWTNAVHTSTIDINNTSSSNSHSVHENENGEDLLFPPDIDSKTQGILVYKGSHLPWKLGTYEFRYHHDGKYNVMATSTPFEVIAPTPGNVHTTESVEQALLSVVQNALGNDSDRMPELPTDTFVGITETEARRIVYAIGKMYTVEFAWEVVLFDGTVSRLSKRIQHALETLSPFTDVSQKRLSLSHGGVSTDRKSLMDSSLTKEMLVAGSPPSLE
ncbi:phospholipid methyltransferase-domain-containing protein [Spinellus fusiger]|nr:phospholipid methyltransferase-domain-containing protein [Spinellus fusiger]